MVGALWDWLNELCFASLLVLSFVCLLCDLAFRSDFAAFGLVYWCLIVLTAWDFCFFVGWYNTDFPCGVGVGFDVFCVVV